MTEKFKIINNAGDYHLINGDEELCYDLCSPTMMPDNWNKVVDKLNKQDMMIKSQDKLIRTLNETILRQTNRIKEFASEEEVDLLTKREKEILDLRTGILELIVENNRLQCLIDDLGGEEMKRQMEVILNE